MRNAQLKAALALRIQVRVFAAVVVISITGCATAGPFTSQSIEGPVRLGEVAAVDGPKVRPDRIIEDSRCPADVQCIQAGRLIVKVTVIGGGWSQQVDLTLGIPVPVADGMLTLVGATPASTKIEQMQSAATRFTFSFQGGR
ncbi:hypothetical protein VB145_20385 [Xanthomonas arboricola]|uniref:hypothetical protein n=1 Tax=Xanthomonas TaxID=338 RepID=UPI00069FE451|nr:MULTISPECIES: hypothetical protein [Xanthomonas]AKU50175.1 hypothetical protein AKJ12_10610 [Xanthomonas arboricola pv. juglandis]KOB27411.1 hypothetical protein AE927_09800 [Xanthomonas arboricola]KOB51021.1 hypothetical protein AE932_03910 [Xanthomonas arboricola]MCE4313378.1 hypothetical protein [Xanthomonas hortorum pv. vitians]MCE4535535.1 hypothetical protein [Xanthomonas hortorum pv. vitians]